MINPCKNGFRVRIAYYHQEYYQIEYSEFEYLPVWKSLDEFIGIDFALDLYSWQPQLFKVDEAQEIAQTLTLDKVNEIHAEENKKMSKWFADKKLWESKNTPYNSKIIKK